MLHTVRRTVKFLFMKMVDILELERHNLTKVILHPNKIYLQHYTKGVQFLGAKIKPYRIYIGNRTKGSFYDTIQEHNKIVKEKKPSEE